MTTSALGRLLSCSRIKKNVTNMITGTISMRRTVLLGLSPAEVKAAKESEPKRPDPPVPDDQVETTFLCEDELDLFH